MVSYPGRTVFTFPVSNNNNNLNDMQTTYLNPLSSHSFESFLSTILDSASDKTNQTIKLGSSFEPRTGQHVGKRASCPYQGVLARMVLKGTWLERGTSRSIRTVLDFLMGFLSPSGMRANENTLLHQSRLHVFTYKQEYLPAEATCTGSGATCPSKYRHF
jgi:hypothetical protein